MRKLAFVVTALIGFTACQGGHEPSPIRGDNADDDAGEVGALVELLAPDGALQVPPVAREGDPRVVDPANEVTFTVDVVDVKDGLVSAAKDLAREVNEELFFDRSEVDTADLCGTVNSNDVHYQFRSGVEEETARPYLIDDLVATKLKPAVEKVMGTSLHELVWFQIYDAGSEIIGTDVLFIRPVGSNQAVRIRIDYAHA